jgi:hypothetical protein
MILRRLAQSLRRQDWFTVVLEIGIVVLGVFLGIQVANWNQDRLDDQRRTQTVDALVTNLEDAISVQQRLVAEIEAGLEAWNAAYAAGAQPAPYRYRMDGSDTAPDVWSALAQMQLTSLLDPYTIVDLTFYYSELGGVGRKYIRYVEFVEDQVLPGLLEGSTAFYLPDATIRPAFRANMDRLREFAAENRALAAWGRCLVYRLETDRVFEDNCRRVDYQLEGMARVPGQAEVHP